MSKQEYLYWKYFTILPLADQLGDSYVAVWCVWLYHNIAEYLIKIISKGTSCLVKKLKAFFLFLFSYVATCYASFWYFSFLY